MKTEVFIPFDGFYESWIDAEIDREIDLRLEDRDLNSEDVAQFRVRHSEIAENYVKLYTEAYAEILWESGIQNMLVEFAFKKLISPREYNFETDRILCTIDTPPHALLLNYFFIGGTAAGLEREIEEMFSSRPGFASFYDDFAAGGWKTKSIDQWDSNELSVLLPHIRQEDFPDSELTRFRESISNAIENVETNDV